MGNIDDFKANLIGGGARANQYRVTIVPPPGIATGLDIRRTSFLATATNLPSSTLGEVAIPLTLWSEMQWNFGRMVLMIMQTILV